MGRRPRALLVDGADTLLSLVEPPWTVYRRVAARHGVSLSSKEIEERARRSTAHHRPPAVEGVPLSRVPELEREGWRAVVRDTLGEALARGRAFDELWDHFASPAAWRVEPGAAQCLDRLRTTGMRTAILSNMDSRLPGLLRGLGLSKRLDLVAIPSTVGLAKPDPGLFSAALSRLDVTAEEAWYVGDREEDCVEAARRAGLHAIRYDPRASPSVRGVLRSWSDLPGRIQRGEA